MAFNGRHVLEIGPGGGHNSLAFFHWNALVSFVEPNPKAQQELVELMRHQKIVSAKWSLFKCKIEEFKSDDQFDIVIAEGFLPGLTARKEVIESISRLVKVNGVVIVTCVDDISFFMEFLKRLIGARLIWMRKAHTFEEKILLLKHAFASHLASLKFASRPVEDWLADCFLNPAIYGTLFSIADCINEFGSNFDFLSSSPRLFTDYSWYKDVDFDNRADLLNQFAAKRHVLLFSNMQESLRNTEENLAFLDGINELRQFAACVESDFTDENTRKVIRLLVKLEEMAKLIENSAWLAIKQTIHLLSLGDLSEVMISQAHDILSACGRGQQYVSMVKK